MYGITSAGSLALVYLLAMLLAFIFSGLGLVISNYNDTMQQAVFVMWFAVVCLMLVSLGVTRLHMLFKPVWMRTSCIDWLAGLCYVSNVVVGCYLSFHFIAPEYGFSFFFAMLATEHVIRGKSAVSSIVPAAVLLALSLGLYQTNLACFCLVLLAYFLLLLFQNGEKQKIREYICKSLASAASGAVLYLLILKITLWATGTAMADYQGGADISV